jgi:hypothetical protein
MSMNSTAPTPRMPMDQTTTDFLSQLRNFARGFLDWVEGEGMEREHAMGSPPQITEGATDEQSGQPTPQPLRTRTTTVTDFSPPAASPAPETIATDPLTAKGEKIMSAMKEQYGPERGEEVFYASKNAGRIEGVDAGDNSDLGERFELSPDGSTIIDKQGGKSYSIEDAMRILFANGDNAVAGPENKVTVAHPTTAIQTATWKSPKITTRSEDEDDTMQGGQLGPEQGWNIPKWPKPTQGDCGGEGGKALGRLLQFKAGDSLQSDANSRISNGDNTMRNGRMKGWILPTSDYGTSEGARKRAQGGGTQRAGTLTEAGRGLESRLAAQGGHPASGARGPAKPMTSGERSALSTMQQHEAKQSALAQRRADWARSRSPNKGPIPTSLDYGTAEGARKREQGGGGVPTQQATQYGRGNFGGQVGNKFVAHTDSHNALASKGWQTKASSGHPPRKSDYSHPDLPGHTIRTQNTYQGWTHTDAQGNHKVGQGAQALQQHLNTLHGRG